MRVCQVAVCLLAVVLAATAASAGVCDEPNLVPGCAFSGSLQTALWSVPVGELVPLPNQGHDSSGCAEARSQSANVEQVRLVSGCFPVTGSTHYGFGGFLASEVGDISGCTLSAVAFSSAACSGDAATETVELEAPLPAEWVPLGGTMTTESGAVSAHLELVCWRWEAGPFSVRVDDVYFGPGVVPVLLQGFSVQ